MTAGPTTRGRGRPPSQARARVETLILLIAVALDGVELRRPDVIAALGVPGRSLDRWLARLGTAGALRSQHTRGGMRWHVNNPPDGVDAVAQTLRARPGFEAAAAANPGGLLAVIARNAHRVGSALGASIAINDQAETPMAAYVEHCRSAQPPGIAINAHTETLITTGAGIRGSAQATGIAIYQPPVHTGTGEPGHGSVTVPSSQACLIVTEQAGTAEQAAAKFSGGANPPSGNRLARAHVRPHARQEASLPVASLQEATLPDSAGSLNQKTSRFNERANQQKMCNAPVAQRRRAGTARSNSKHADPLTASSVYAEPANIGLTRSCTPVNLAEPERAQTETEMRDNAPSETGNRVEPASAAKPKRVAKPRKAAKPDQQIDPVILALAKSAAEAYAQLRWERTHEHRSFWKKDRPWESKFWAHWVRIANLCVTDRVEPHELILAAFEQIRGDQVFPQPWFFTPERLRAVREEWRAKVSQDAPRDAQQRETWLAERAKGGLEVTGLIAPSVRTTARLWTQWSARGLGLDAFLIGHGAHCSPWWAVIQPWWAERRTAVLARQAELRRSEFDQAERGAPYQIEALREAERQGIADAQR